MNDWAETGEDGQRAPGIAETYFMVRPPLLLLDASFFGCADYILRLGILD
jgi:hypothetical protein